MTLALALLAGWLAIGAAVGFAQVRRGHWAKLPILAALVGPFALALARLAREREAQSRPRVLGVGRPGPGDVDVLIGLDGSAASVAAVDAAVQLFGARLRRLDLATVLDFDTAAPHADSLLQPAPWDEEEDAWRMLAGVAERLERATGIRASTVVLAGRPATALEDYARAQHVDLVVLGAPHRDLAHAVTGSCAARTTRTSSVPVLVVPAPVIPAGGDGAR